jgi:Family of unknown function (DUF6228)
MKTRRSAAARRKATNVEAESLWVSSPAPAPPELSVVRANCHAMDEPVIIRSAQDGSVLELHHTERPDIFRTRVRGRGLEATIEVYEIGPPKHLGHFFRDLAVHSRGCLEEKRWGSFDKQLILTAKSDSTGRTDLHVELRGGLFYEWRVEGSLSIEAGQLDKIASDVESFVQWSPVA